MKVSSHPTGVRGWCKRSFEHRLRPFPLPTLISPALYLEQRQRRPLGAASFEQGCSFPHLRDTGFRGSQQIFTQCVYYCSPFTAHHSLVEASSLHPELGIRCPMSSVKGSPAYKEGHVAGSFLAPQIAVKYCPKCVQNCLNHLHQRIHFPLALW